MNNQNSIKGKVAEFFKWSLANGFVFVLFIFLFSASWVVVGSFLQNDNQGYFLVNFDGNQDGIVSASQTSLRQNITVDIVAGVAKISSGSNSGFFATNDIKPASFNLWDKIEIATTVLSSPQDVLVSLYTCGATPTPISGFQNMQPSLAGSNLSLNINMLSPSVYDCVKVMVLLNNSSGVAGLSPVLDWVRVSWNPKPLFIVGASSSPSTPAGSVYTVTVSYSNSFVESSGTVVWMQLPNYLNGTIINYTTAYNQNPQTSLSSASNGGTYTAGGTNVNGISIPAGSVYWDLGLLPAGKSGTLIARLQTVSGWENGMTLLHTVHMASLSGGDVVSDSNSQVSGNQPMEVIISSAPAPVMKKSVSGVATVNGVNYVINSSPYTPTVTYTLILENTMAQTGRETIFNPIIRDNVSNILNNLTSICGIANPFATRFIVNNNGSYNPTDQTITWSTGLGSFGNVPPGSSVSVTYTVDYTGCSSGVFNNTVTATANNISSVSDSKSVTVGINSNPQGTFAKGDKINTSQSITASNDDNPYVQQTYGDTFSYLLYAHNNGMVAFGEVVMADKISSDLDFISASLPSNITGGLVYYNTSGAGNAPNTPPTFSTTGSGITGSGWSTTLPANPTDVRWVAFYVPCLNSQYFPSSPSNTTCQNQPIATTATINVRIRPIANVCLEKESVNTGVFYIHRSSSDVSNSSLSDLPSPIVQIDNEQTHIGPSLASFSANSTVTGSGFMQPGNSSTYTFTVKNTGNDNAQNTKLTINIPQANINGNLEFIDFVSATGGNVTTIIDPVSLKVSVVIIDLGTIFQNATKTATITLNLPNGALANSTFDVIGIVSAEDDNNCQNITSNISRRVTVESTPVLDTVKKVSEKIIPGGDTIHYEIDYRNIGNSPSTNTYIVDRIPDKTVFEYAYTSGTDSTGNTFTCNGCSVYFSKNTTNLPSSLSSASPINLQLISTYFAVGQQISPGVWIPQGYPANEALWVAWRIDDQSLSIPMFLAGSAAKVGLTVRNDDNGSTPPLVFSPIGTILSNAAAVLADILPQAIGDQVFTTILPDPGLSLDKTSSKDYLRAGEIFDWNIEYYNDSGNPDTLVSITDDLPLGVTLNAVYHTWNFTAVSGGMPSGEVNITTDPSVSISGNQIIFSPTIFKGGDLEKLEGGTIRLSVSVNNGVPSGSILINDVNGFFENQSGSFSVFDSDDVFVENPDLFMRKQSDILDPVSGDILNYTLIVSNEGFYDAPNVEITDTLPAGLCYVGPTSVINPTWSLPEPVISGGPCATAPSTLTWTSNIQGNGYPTGTIPANSPDIFIRYRIQVANVVAPGVSLLNGACLSTIIPEDPIYPNCSGALVTTPLPDPFVFKQVEPTVIPGNNVNYAITYGNNTRQSASNSYIIDTLPDWDNDGNADLRIISVTPVNGEQFFYHDAPVSGTPPTFNPAFPLSGGWQSSWTSDTSYIAILTGPLPALAGPYSILVTMQATDPQTGIVLPTGISLTNTVQIFLPIGETDQDNTNNVATATVVTPGIDLWIQKIGSSEGGFPGVGPGEQVTYTVRFGNQGTVLACDVYIQDVFSSTFNPPSIVHNAGNLSLYDASGNPVFPTDPTGIPIITPVSISFSGTNGNYRFDLGNSNTCLPPGSTGEFEVYAIADPNAQDGTVVSNTGIIGEDSPDVEEILSNNTSTSQTVVYRADLMINKTGISKGPDGILGTPDDSTIQTSAGERIRYTLQYDNIGSAPAQNASITEDIPSGLCYVAGSISGYPADASIVFSNDNGISYNYIPIPPVDCAVTHFRVLFGSPIYPGNSVGEDVSIGSMGISTNVSQNGPTLNRFLRLTSTINPIFLSNRSDGLSNFRKDLSVDFNNDGLLDILNSSPTDYSLAIRNTSTPGNVSFDTADAFVLPAFGSQAQVADFNKDGLQDIVVTSDSLVWVFQNNSTSSQIQFTNYINLPSGCLVTQEPLVADFNNDGLEDILFLEHSGGCNILIYKNTSSGGTISFDTITPSVLSTGGFSTPFNKIFDVDGDGKKDILVSRAGLGSDYAVVFRNTTDTTNDTNPITFDPGVIISTAPYMWQSDLKIADLNNDGKDDVVVVSGPLAGIEVLENNSTPGSISFSNRLLYLNGFRNFTESTIADIDEDGFLDIVAPLSVDSGFSENIFVFKNTTSSGGSSISFATPLQLLSSPVESESKVEVVDFDNDSKNDLVVRYRTPNAVAIFRNTTSGSGSFTFSSPLVTNLSGNGGASNMLIADIDQDLKKDIVVPGYYGPTFVLQNNSTPTVIRIDSLINLGNTMGAYYPHPIFEDFDKAVNGNKDLAINSYNSGTYAFRNNSVPGSISFGDSATSGSYVVPINISSGFWKMLQVKHMKPSGTELTYTIYDDTCGGTPLIPSTTLPNQFIDISSLGSQTNVCLVIDFSTISTQTTPILDAWQMTYVGGVPPEIIFEVLVSNSMGSNQIITNTASIQTDTEEITYDNNTDTHTFGMAQSDVAITKSVNLASADVGDTLFYTLNYTNNGPLDAHNVSIQDVLPAGVSPISWSQISGVDPVTCIIDYGNNSISCTDSTTPDWVLSPGESGSIQIEAQISSGGIGINLTHTTQTDFQTGGSGEYYSTTAIPGSITPININIPVNISASSIDYIQLEVYDENFNVIEATYGNASDLVNFTITSLNPITLQYTGPLPVNVAYFNLFMTLSGSSTSFFSLGLYDNLGTNSVNYFDVSTDNAFDSGFMADPLDLANQMVLQTIAPGFSVTPNNGSSQIAPFSYYINSFNMPSSACPSGSRKWGVLDIDKVDPQDNVYVHISGDSSFSLPILYLPGSSVEDLFNLYGYAIPSTLYYRINIDRNDPSYIPEVRSVSIETICDGSISAGDILTNLAVISTSSRDTNPTNNSATASTFIGDISNLRITKTGPTNTSIGSSFVYTLDIENNGSVPAQNIVLTENLPSQVNFVSASSSGSISFTCSGTSVLTCNGSGPLNPGQLATINITVSVPNNIALIGQILNNQAGVSTTTPEVTIVDNLATLNTTIIPLGSSSISGYVFLDLNGDVFKTPSEPGISGVSVFLSGKDIYGAVYGPDKVVSPAQYQESMQTLVGMGLIPNRPYMATDPYPPNYFVINPFITLSTGAWSFNNFNPGTYAILEQHPGGYTSTGSRAGYRRVDISGNPIYDLVVDGDGSEDVFTSPSDNTDPDKITKIILGQNQNAINYYFGEINGSIGDQVFNDLNADGTFNGTDVGIANVEITLYTDLNSNGIIDPGEPSQTQMTNASGNYLFTGLLINTQYIVKITDSAGILSSYNAMIGPSPGINNNAQNPNGYIVTLTLLNSNNLTADFGYHSPDNVCVGPNCNPGGGGGSNPPVVIGAIGNQVFYDENADGIFQNNEIGIPNVEVTLVTDLNRNGLRDINEPTRAVLTNQVGDYMFTALDISYQYIVIVTDSQNVLFEFTQTFGTIPGADNHSKNTGCIGSVCTGGYLVQLTALNPINRTADFGFSGYELPRTGQSAIGRISFGVSLIVVTILVLFGFKNYDLLTKRFLQIIIKNNNGRT